MTTCCASSHATRSAEHHPSDGTRSSKDGTCSSKNGTCSRKNAPRGKWAPPATSANSRPLSGQRVLPPGELGDSPTLLLGWSPPAGFPHGNRRGRLDRGFKARIERCKVLVQCPARLGGAAARRKSRNPEQADACVERDGQHVARLHCLCGSGNALAIKPHVTGGCQRRRGTARAHNSCMPQPFVDALAFLARAAALADKWPSKA